MPELGKATYSLILNSAQFNEGLAASEARANAATASIGRSLGLVETEYTEAGVIANEAADEVVIANERMAESTVAGAATAGAAMTGMKAKFLAMGKVGKGGAMMAGALAGYFFVKGGINYIKTVQESMLQVNNAVKNTGRLTGVTTKDIKGLAEAFTGVRGQTYAVNLQTASMLARMSNLRNMGPGIGMVYNRAFTAVEDVVAATGKNARMIAVAIGKALQDPLKNFNVLSRTGIQFNKDLITQIFKTKGPLAAQNYILGEIEKKYGGSAKEALKSYTAQWTRFKEQLDKIAANVMSKLIPVFSKIGGYLNKHPRLIKILIYSLLGLAGAFTVVKLAAIACNTAMLMKGAVVGVARMLGFGTAATVVEGEVIAAGAGMNLALLPILGTLAALVVGAAAVAYAFTSLMNMLPDKWNPLKGIRAHLADSVLGAPSAPQESAHGAAFVNAIRARYAFLRKSGMSAADVITSIMRQNPGLTKHDIEIYTQSGAAKGKADGSRPYGAPPTDFNTPVKPKTTKSTGLLPLQMQIDEAIAQRHGVKAQIAVLNREQTYLQNLLAHTTNKSKQLEIQQQLSSIWSSLQGFKKPGAKSSLGGILGKLPGYNQLVYNVAKAETTKGLKDDRKALKAEEEFLQGIVNNRKYSLAVRTKAATDLKTILNKLKAVNKDITSGVQATAQELQAAMNLRGTFFGQFAGDVFGQSAAGMTVGAQRSGDVNYNQHNTFHEIPKDRHQLARQARAAAVRALST